jgi:hypothetical protein
LDLREIGKGGNLIELMENRLELRGFDNTDVEILGSVAKEVYSWLDVNKSQIYDDEVGRIVTGSLLEDGITVV